MAGTPLTLVLLDDAAQGTALRAAAPRNSKWLCFEASAGGVVPEGRLLFPSMETKVLSPVPVKALEWSGKWSRELGVDNAFTIDGLHLPTVFQADWTFLVDEVLRTALQLREAMQRMSPSAIMTPNPVPPRQLVLGQGESLLSEIARTLCSRGRVRHRIVPAKRGSLGQQYRPPQGQRRRYQAGLDRMKGKDIFLVQDHHLAARLTPVRKMLNQVQWVAQGPRPKRPLHGVFYIVEPENETLSQDHQKRLLAAQKQLRTAVENHDGEVLGVPLVEMLASRFRYFADVLAGAALQRYLAQRRFLEALRPRAVILGQDTSPAGKLLCMAAKSLDIPTIVVQQQVTSDVQCSRESVIPPIPFLPLTADVMSLWGRMSVDVLRHHGASPERLQATGAPWLDELAKRKQFPERNPEPTILLALQHAPKGRRFTMYNLPPSQYMPMVDALIRVIHRNPGWKLVIRPHPEDRFSNNLRNSSRDSSDRVTVDNSTDLWDQLESCDAVVTFFSSVAVDALVMGKPLVTMNFDGTSEKMPYARSGVALEARNETELDQMLMQALEPASDYRVHFPVNRENFVQWVASGADGHSATRLAALIDLISRQPTMAAAAR